MKVAVTGGAGFIGSHFVKYLLNKYPSCSVLNIDKLTYAGNMENLRDIDACANHLFIKQDICNRQAVEKVLSGCDIIVNFAAESHVDRSIADPGIFLKTDAEGTFNLLEIARKSGIGKYIQISTDEVYGSAEGSETFTENSPLRPSNPYAASKAAADLLTLSYHATYGIPVNIIRSTNNYGPNQHPEKLIPLLITNALEDKKLPIYGDGKNIRDWLFVEDNCRAIDTVLHKGLPGEIYNVAAGNEKENLFIAGEIIGMLDKPASCISFVKDRPGHDRRYSLSCAKLQKLGWQPITPLPEGLRLTVEWYRGNTGWWRSIKEGPFRNYYETRYGK